MKIVTHITKQIKNLRDEAKELKTSPKLQEKYFQIEFLEKIVKELEVKRSQDNLL